MRQRQHASTITRKINDRARARVLGRAGREPLVQTGLLHGEVGKRDAWCFNFFPFSTDAPVTAAKIRPAAPSASMRIISMAIPIASCSGALHGFTRPERSTLSTSGELRHHCSRRATAPSAMLRPRRLSAPAALLSRARAITPSNSAVAAAAIRTSLRKRVGRRQKHRAGAYSSSEVRRTAYVSGPTVAHPDDDADGRQERALSAAK